MMTPKILVVGAGAVGGYFGARLAASGHDVTFLVRPRRQAQLSATGLCLASPLGDATLTPCMVTADRIAQPYDIIILSVKAYSLAAAMVDMAPAIGPQTRIIPLLNGMQHLDVLASRFGREAVMGGTCFIVSSLDAEGRIHQVGVTPRLVFGPLVAGQDATAIADALRAPGFDTVPSPHILQDMWNKWSLLASLGTLCCLMRASVGEVARLPGGTDFVHATIKECTTIAAAAGYPLAADTVNGIVKRLTQPDSTLTSSMFRDLSQGAPVEAQQIIGDLVARARAHGVATPILDLTDLNLRAYELRRNEK
ncbi:2-dehydropantoate 2-reductase [Komagataeibacter sucrofermentans DSM 15973]|nr:ketopantoate reductase family protein [Komagataeibacter sucrofermentans]GBQ50578.1 2-dehydropantoate 2-reductase [Komagataeibacter sucrofermentans DSM 15973]